VPGNTWRGRP